VSRRRSYALPPPNEIPEINNPAIQRAGYLGSPSCHWAPHTAQAASRDPAGRGQAALTARGFLLRKTRCFRLRKFGFYVSELWAHPPHTHNRVGTTDRSEAGLRVVIATGAWAAEREQELLAGPFKPTLQPPWISQWLASGVSGWIRTRRVDRRSVILSCHSSTEDKAYCCFGT